MPNLYLAKLDFVFQSAHLTSLTAYRCPGFHRLCVLMTTFYQILRAATIHAQVHRRFASVH
jgi:hypothetical protein